MNRHQFLRATVAAAALLGLSATSVHAQTAATAYPNKPVRVIVPFPPGGTLDLVGRMLAQKMGESTGQTFVIENRPGGNGFIGADAVAKAAADGYTLLFNASTFTTGPMVNSAAPYDVNRDFTPVVLVAQAPLAVSVNNDLPAKDIAGLVTYAKANPGKLNFAIGSTGSAGHLSTELLRRAGGMELTIVPYKGTAPAFQDLIGGQIQGFVDPLLGAMNFHKAGKLRILAVSSKNRLPNLPDVPTVGETVPGYEFYSWYGLWGPAKMPADITAKLNAEANKALATDMRDKLTSQGLIVNGGSVEDIVRFQRDDMAKSQKIITDGNIRAQ
jgi:tripartite-type tricarboxylate transporter receptor subunit TctC